MHVSKFLYAAAHRGKVPWELVRDIERRHLKARCGTCAEAVKALHSGLEGAQLDELRPPADPLERLRVRRRISRRQFRDDVKTARWWVRRLIRKVPAGERVGTVQRAYKHYRGSVFGLLLLEEARAAIPVDPAESLSLAEAALESCAQTQKKDPDPQVRVPALAVKGNALRALGRLSAAEAALVEASRLLHASDLEDHFLAAEIDSFMGSLRIDQNRLDDAARHVERAAQLYSVLGKHEKAAKNFLLFGVVAYQTHSFRSAVEAGEMALDLLGSETHGPLLAYAHYNLAYFLHGQGDLDRAEAELDDHRELLEAAGKTVVAHVAWLRGRIAWSRGHLEKADRLFREALRWAKDCKHHFDAGLLYLERALVHFARGRTDRVQRLAAQALGLFAREEVVGRETAGALELLEAAIQQETLSRKALEHTVVSLEKARRSCPGREPAGTDR